MLRHYNLLDVTKRIYWTLFFRHKKKTRLSNFVLTLSDRPPQQYNMKMLLTSFLFILLAYTTVTKVSCADTISPISSTRTQSTSTDVLKEVNKATFSVEATSLDSVGKSKKGKKGNKGNKVNKSKRGNKGNKGNSPTPAPTPVTTPPPRRVPTPVPTPTFPPCLDNGSFNTALDLWFSDPDSATITYGNIADW